MGDDQLEDLGYAASNDPAMNLNISRLREELSHINQRLEGLNKRLDRIEELLGEE